jgi:hypothetical protein
MRRVILVALLLAPFITSCGGTYLDREELDLPINGTAVVTTKPLKPFARYILRISSPLSIYPFRTEVKHFFSSSYYWNFTWEGADAALSHHENGMNGLYNHVVFIAQGAGTPLHFQTDQDFTTKFASPTLSLLVLRSRWWRHDDGTIDPMIYVGLGLLVVFFAILTAQACHHAKAAEPEEEREDLLRPGHMWWSPEPIPAGVPMKVHITGFYEEDRCTNNYSYWYSDACMRFQGHDQPGKYKQHKKLFFDNLPDHAVPFRKLEHLHEYDFLYYGTGNQLLLLLTTTRAGRVKDGLSVSIQELDASDRLLAGLDNPPRLVSWVTQHQQWLLEHENLTDLAYQKNLLWRHRRAYHDALRHWNPGVQALQLQPYPASVPIADWRTTSQALDDEELREYLATHEPRLLNILQAMQYLSHEAEKVAIRPSTANDHLALMDAQLEQITSINARAHEMQEKIRADARLSAEEMKEQVEWIETIRRQRIQELLKEDDRGTGKDEIISPE